MEKERLKGVRSVLESYCNDYLNALKRTDKDRVEKLVRNYVETLPSELYIELNEGFADGLCKPGFFESDLNRCLRILKNKINE